MRRLAILGVAALPALLGTGCGDHEFHPPSEEERRVVADTAYSPALFDSISWGSEAERLQAGNLVFADECRRCHGPVGRGDTDYAREHDLDVPSLVNRDWELKGDVEGVRRVIFTGHLGGMPAWGVVELTPREIDAAADYLVNQLRPEVLADTTTLPPPESPPES